MLKFEVENNMIWPPSTKTPVNLCLLNQKPKETRCHDTRKLSIKSNFYPTLYFFQSIIKYIYRLQLNRAPIVYWVLIFLSSGLGVFTISWHQNYQESILAGLMTDSSSQPEISSLLTICRCSIMNCHRHCWVSFTVEYVNFY